MLRRVKVECGLDVTRIFDCFLFFERLAVCSASLEITEWALSLKSLCTSRGDICHHGVPASQLSSQLSEPLSSREDCLWAAPSRVQLPPGLKVVPSSGGFSADLIDTNSCCGSCHPGSGACSNSGLMGDLGTGKECC